MRLRLEQVTSVDHLRAQPSHVALVDTQHPDEVLLRRRDITTLAIKQRRERMGVRGRERDATRRLIAIE